MLQVSRIFRKIVNIFRMFVCIFQILKRGSTVLRINQFGTINYKKNLKYIKEGMQEESKYSILDNRLKNFHEENYNGSIQGATYYFFKNLQELTIDLISQQKEISQYEQKIIFMEAKFKELEVRQTLRKRKEKEQKNHQRITEVVHRFPCDQQQCEKRFPNVMKLHFHQLLHHSEQNFCANNSFNFKISSIEEQNGHQNMKSDKL